VPILRFAAVAWMQAGPGRRARLVAAAVVLVIAPFVNPAMVVAVALLLAAAAVDVPSGRYARPAYGIDVLAAAVVGALTPMATRAFIPLWVAAALTLWAAVGNVRLRPAEMAAALATPVVAAIASDVAVGASVPLYIDVSAAVACSLLFFVWWRFPLLLSGLAAFSLLSHDLCGLLGSVRWALRAPLSPDELDTHVAARLDSAQRISAALRPTAARHRARIVPAPWASESGDAGPPLVRVDAGALAAVYAMVELVTEARSSVTHIGRTMVIRRPLLGERWAAVVTAEMANRALLRPHQVRIDGDSMVIELRTVPQSAVTTRSSPWRTDPTCSLSTAVMPSTEPSTHSQARA
jgi:hypothetical protein